MEESKVVTPNGVSFLKQFHSCNRGNCSVELLRTAFHKDTIAQFNEKNNDILGDDYVSPSIKGM